MNAFSAYADRHRTAPNRRVRFDAPDRAPDTHDAVYLRGWVARQADLYNDLLKTIAHAPRPPRGA